MLLPLLHQFIADCRKGYRVLPNGTRINEKSVKGYEFLAKILADFQKVEKFKLRVRQLNGNNSAENLEERNYWRKFYIEFSDYLNYDRNYSDNYIGANFKMIKALLNYIDKYHGIETKSYNELLYVRTETIPIIALFPAQLRFLIFDLPFEQTLSESLRRTKDIFVFGSTMALRFSDLRTLTIHNLNKTDFGTYLKVKSKKTATDTTVLLPDYAINILNRLAYPNGTLLPKISLFNLNKNLKKLFEVAGWTEPIGKFRMKDGKPIEHKTKNGKGFRFCDMASSHVMRRTAITNMLMRGVPENLVRKISGHSPLSKEFYRYVALSQDYQDTQMRKMYDDIAKGN
jgi:hypothetical protein